jgi:hypothetical protein
LEGYITDATSSISCLATLSPTAAPTDAPTSKPTEPPTDAEATETQLAVGSNLEVIATGIHYALGDELRLGEDTEGWARPALVEVTGVNENGGATAAAIIDGGSFTGDNILGNYNLTPVHAALLMMSSSSEAASAPSAAVGSNSVGSSRARNSSPAGIYVAGLVAPVLGVVAFIAAKIRARFSSSTTSPVVQQQHRDTSLILTLTPALCSEL